VLRILRDDLPVVGVARKVVDQVEKQRPAALSPELPEVGSRELRGEVVFELSPIPTG